ncbi:MAG TPA: HU family DNA-binding protein [Chitinophagales bacterium]|nr:HU family DNA-binding protein [Chitinophagales bacterium]MCB9075474.1 HU family DNA-binding protein [Chitinophagales bacterium]HMU97765.1 HU family DNA-binding protein [Chitinophagales bacterium]HMV03239.1 HU family DNA-binding protein [Chitinophagales bacterium]HMW93275.1 HU family DNA-binding protein [Chitinophagales bacterium]
MNKGDLVKVIADAAGVTNAKATDALNAILDGMGKTLKKGDKVTLVGFGTFSTSKRAKRIGRNPSTGEKITIPAKTTVKFKAGKELSESVNKTKK